MPAKKFEPMCYGITLKIKNSKKVRKFLKLMSEKAERDFKKLQKILIRG